MNSMRQNILDWYEYSNKGSDWTEAFKLAISELKNNAGGLLYVPAGHYPTRSIRLYSNMTLQIESGAVLEFMDDATDYEVVETEWEGKKDTMYMPCIYVSHAQNVTICGQGTINGNGSRWWKERSNLPYKRPYLICFEYSEHVRLEGVFLTNSPAWTVHPLYCSDVIVHGIRIKNPSDSPNTDGIDPDSSTNVRISDCMIDVGDDCIAIKAGTEHIMDKKPCENILITNCNMIHGHGGVVIGSEMSGSIRNVTVSNCVFQDTDRGIRLKTRRQRGGAMENLNFQNIVMDRVICPFIFNMYYRCGTSEADRYVWEKTPYPVNEGTPVIRNIMISNIRVTNAHAAAGFMYGLAEQYVENITFSNCQIEMAENARPAVPAMMAHLEPMQQAGFFMRNASNIIFDNVKITNVTGQEIDSDHTVDLHMK